VDMYLSLYRFAIQTHAVLVCVEQGYRPNSGSGMQVYSSVPDRGSSPLAQLRNLSGSSSEHVSAQPLGAETGGILNDK
jgi:hypothetical protein